MKKHKTLILNGSTTKGLVGIKEAVRAVEKAFRLYGEGKVHMPPKLYLDLPQFKGDFRAMPVWIEGMKYCGIKWVNVHPQNRKIGLPTVMAQLILSDPGSGLPLCIMESTYLTAMRTGAAGGVAAKYLARPGSETLGLVGCGRQAAMQLAAVLQVFNIKRVKAWSLRQKEAEAFVKRMSRTKGMRMETVSTIRECVRDSDIVVTTTPSTKPIVKAEWIKEGTHINAIGADAKGKEELEPAILKKAKIVVDAWEQASHSGEINVPLAKGKISRKDIYADIGEVVIGRKRRTTRKEITVFDSTGLAIQDLAVASLVFSKALRLGKGKFINFV